MDGAVNVLVNANLEITFNEDVQTGSGNITIKKSSDDSNVEVIDVASMGVAVSNDKITIDPTGDLPLEEELYVLVDNGAIEDLAANPFSGISSKTSWNFRTEDTTSPTISGLTPADDAAGVTEDENLEAVFDENIQKGIGNILIMQSADDVTFETIDVASGQATVDGSQLMINPSMSLQEFTGYYIQIDAGAVKDLGGNDFAGISNKNTWNFTTGEFTDPEVITQDITIALDDNGVAIVTPSQIDNGSTDNVTLQNDLVLILDQTTFDCDDLGDNTVSLTVTDEAGNSGTGMATVTIEDVTAPTVLAQGITVNLNASGEATITPSDIDDGSSDNCSLSLSLDNSNFDQTDLGDNQVTLTATDGSGNVALVTIIVTVELTNLPPVIVDQEFEVDENSADGTVVGTLTASDPDNDPLTFSITAGNTAAAFAITNNSGDLTVDNSSALDFETTPSFLLTVSVDDGNGETDEAFITINLRDVEVEKEPQTITFDPIASKSEGDPFFALSATASSGLTVEFSIVTGPGTISGNEFSLTGPGSITIKASQPGDAEFSPAADVEQSFCVNPGKPVITIQMAGVFAITLSSSSEDGNQWHKDGQPVDGASDETLNALETGIYAVQVTIDGCSSEFSTDQEVIITGIDQRLKTDLKIYPNPSRNYLIIEREGTMLNPVEISVYSSTGRLIYNETPDNLLDTENIRLSTAHLDRGVYFYLLSGTDFSVRGRFSKE